jgi:hypothetical protein
MILTGKNLELILRELYGHNWLKDSAKDIGCTPRTIWNWTHGATQPPARFCGKIRRALAAKADRIQGWAQEL